MKKFLCFLIATVMSLYSFACVMAEPVEENSDTQAESVETANIDKEDIKKAVADSGLTEITGETGDSEKLSIQNLLGIITIGNSSVETAAMTEEDIIKLAVRLVKTANYNTGMRRLAEYDAEQEGKPGLYSMDSFENLIYRLSGVRLNLVSHECSDSLCILNSKSEVGSYSTIDQRAVGMERRRTGVIIKKAEKNDVNYCVIDSIFSLGEDRFLILYNNHNALVDTDSDVNYYDETKLLADASDFAAEPQSKVFTYAVVGKRIYNGVEEYYMIEQGGKNVDINQIKKHIIETEKESKPLVDYAAIEDYTEISQYTEYLESKLTKKSMTGGEKRDIARYIECVTERLSGVSLDAKENAVTITDDVLKEATDKSQTALKELKKILTKKSISLNEEIDITVRVNVNGTDMQSGLTVTLDSSLVNQAERFDNVKIAYRDNQGIKIKSENLKNFLSSGNISFKIIKAVSGYDIDFFDKDMEKIKSLQLPVTVAFESDNFYDSIYLKRDGEGKNYGGHNNLADKTIEFSTVLPGNYYVNVNRKDFSDISGLSDDEKNAVEYMVSKGYFELEDGNFNPHQALSRYEFARILAVANGCLDKYAVCNLADVDITDEYYDYVASVYQSGIMTGYGDNTFRGNKTVTGGEVISQAMRLFKEAIGSVPSDDNSYKTADIAMAVREGIIKNGKVFAVDAPITKLEAAVIFYRSFESVYDIVPSETVKILEATSTDEKKSGGVIPIIICILAMGVAIGTGVHVYRNRRIY